MKKAYIITSAIELNNIHPLTYNPKRTCFSTADRLQHTIMTITSMDLLSDNETTLYLLDMSDNWQEYYHLFSYQKNLKFISVKEHLPEIYNTVTTHANKSHCETLLLSTFMRVFREELAQYDYTFKITGRYFLDSTFDTSIFNEHNTDKIFYKKPLKFQWNDSWNYDQVDLRKEQKDNTLRQYCSVAFGWGKQHQDHFLDLFTGIAAMLSQPHMVHMDIETFGYYFTRPFADSIIETDWIVYGWDGCNGKFMRY